MTASAFTTKQDLDNLYVRIEKMIGEVVGDIMGNALQLISERFDQVGKRFDRLEARMDRMEDKLDRTAAFVDLHTVDIRELQRRAA